MSKKNQIDPSKYLTFKCIYCGKEFTRRKCEVDFRLRRGAKEPMFCCKQHMLQYNVEHVQSHEFVCETCGKTFTRTERQIKNAALHKEPIRFCSRECKDKSWGKNRVEVVCDICGTKFLKQKKNIHKHNYCSKECYDKYKKDQIVTLKCPTCGLEFTRTKGYIAKANRRGQNVRYCSKDCARFGSLLKKLFIGNIDMADYKDFCQNLTCEYCGEHFQLKTTEAMLKLYIQTKNRPEIKTFCTNRCRKQYLKTHTSVEQICANCNKSFMITKNEFMHGRTFCTEACRKQFFNRKNKDCDLLSRLRGTLQYRHWRQNVAMRDKFTCQNCGSTENLHVHHIKELYKIAEENHNDYEKTLQSYDFNDINNGITLCSECHSKIHPWMRKYNDLSFLNSPVALTTPEDAIKDNGKNLES